MWEIHESYSGSDNCYRLHLTTPSGNVLIYTTADSRDAKMFRAELLMSQRRQVPESEPKDIYNKAMDTVRVALDRNNVRIFTAIERESIRADILKNVGRWLEQLFDPVYRGALVSQHSIDIIKEGRMP